MSVLTPSVTRMTHVVLFHHVAGLTEGVTALADRWRAAGHEVTAPDLFEGRTFGSVEEGFAFVQTIGGFDEVRSRALTAVSDLPEAVVYAGISMGVVAAQHVAAQRPGAVAGVFLESFVAPEYVGEWPAGAPVQIHGMEGDEFFGLEDLEPARAFAAARDDVEVFTYPGDAHLFVDSSLPAHDPDAAALVDERVLAFLATL